MLFVAPDCTARTSRYVVTIAFQSRELLMVGLALYWPVLETMAYSGYSTRPDALTLPVRVMSAVTVSVPVPSVAIVPKISSFACPVMRLAPELGVVLVPADWLYLSQKPVAATPENSLTEIIRRLVVA